MADDIATLGLQVDSTSVQKGTEDLRNFEAVAKRTGETVQQVQARFQAAQKASGAATMQASGALAHQAAVHANVASASANTNREIAGLEKAFGILLQQLEHSAGSLGRLGSALLSFGTIGVGVAGVAGTLVEVFHVINEMSARLGEKALQMQAFSTVTGLTAENIQVLTHAAEELGVSTESSRTFLQRLTINMTQLRTASGEAYAQVLRVDSALADELTNAKSTEEAINLLAKAFAAAGENGNKLLQAIGGRGGAAFGPVLKEIAEAGSLENMAHHMQGVITLTNAETKELAIIMGQLNSIRSINADLVAKLWAKEALEGQLEYNRVLNDTVTSMQGLTTRGDEFIAKWLPFLAIASRLNPFTGAQRVAARIAAGAGAGNFPDVSAFGTGLGTEARPSIAPATPAGQRANPEAYANQLKLLAAALGNATTEQEKFTLKLAEAEATRKRGEFGVLDSAEAMKNYGRAIADINLEHLVNMTKDFMSVIGPAATEQEKLNQQLQQLQLTASRTGASFEDLRRGQRGLQEEFNINQLRANVAALGNAATITEQYDLKQKNLAFDLAHGKITQDYYNRAVEQLPLDKQLEKQRATISALGDAATAAEEYALKINELAQQLKEGRIQQDTFNRAVQNLEPTFKQLREFSTSFTDSFVRGMLDGKSATEALQTSLHALTAEAASSTIKNIAKGDLSSAAVSATVTAASFISEKIFNRGKSEAQKQQEYQAQLAAAQAAQQHLEEQLSLNLDASRRVALASLDTASAQYQIVQKQIQWQEEVYAAQRKGLDIGELVGAQAVELDRLLTQLRTGLQKSIESQINSLQGRDYINQVSDLFASIAQMQKDAATLGVDPARIQVLFQLKAQDIVNQAQLAGTAFDEFITMFPELKGVVIESTAALAESIKELQAFGKTIRDYLTNLQFGQLSVLSPQQQLAAAQEAFNTQYALAQQGNKEALSTITQTADTLLSAAKAFYASSAGYATIYGQVTTELSGLSSVTGGRQGGLLGYSSGGVIKGGIYDIDSVLGRFASGGAVALAGGEYITRATSVNADTLPMLRQINRTGSANDNTRQNFADLARTFVSVGNTLANRLVVLETAYRDAGKQAQDAARIAANRTLRPGKISAT